MCDARIEISRHLEEMILRRARLRAVRWEEALDLFPRRAAGTPLRWFLYARPYSPFHCGGRLFKNASMPSRKSWLI